MKHCLSITLGFISLLALAACGDASPDIQRGGGYKGSYSAPPLMKETTANKEGMIGHIPKDATPIKVGILLPLSGEAASVGEAMLDAAMLALNDEYMSVPSNQIKSQIILIPKDTGNSANSAAAAARQAISDGATFLVGPLFSQAVTAMKPLLKETNVPVISFSNNKVVAEPNIYTFGYLPEQQVSRIGEYAYLNDLQRVALLAPNDAYGQKVRDELSTMYSKKGGFVSPAELFSRSQANIEAAVARLMAAYNNTTDDRKFEALFVADNGYNMHNIVNALGKHNFDFENIKIFGTSLWDDRELGDIRHLRGAMFPGAPQEPFIRFKKRFMAAYGYEPSRLTSLSYDAISLLARLSISKKDETINASLIPKENGYIAPANGLYRLLPNGTSERRLSILKVVDGGFEVVEPSLNSFEEAGR